MDKRHFLYCHSPTHPQHELGVTTKSVGTHLTELGLHIFLMKKDGEGGN